MTRPTYILGDIHSDYGGLLAIATEHQEFPAIIQINRHCVKNKPESRIDRSFTHFHLRTKYARLSDHSWP